MTHQSFKKLLVLSTAAIMVFGGVEVKTAHANAVIKTEKGAAKTVNFRLIAKGFDITMNPDNTFTLILKNPGAVYKEGEEDNDANEEETWADEVPSEEDGESLEEFIAETYNSFHQNPPTASILWYTQGDKSETRAFTVLSQAVQDGNLVVTGRPAKDESGNLTFKEEDKSEGTVHYWVDGWWEQ